MADTTYLSNQFLIAMPSLADPNFARTVTYICSHDDSGALGIVINRPLELTLGELLDHIQLPAPRQPLVDQTVFSGGPVQPQQGFVLHDPIGDWDSTLQVSERLGLTTSSDILQALSEDRGPQRMLVALGYAGWGAGQLEQELVDNAWLSGPADTDILFETPVEHRWAAAAALLGVDLRLLSGDAGHA
ncbi:MAG: YqgE/AlgH family protein [Candidatus Competibacterales bacterium]|nr:YqgE/AlgH family protein [Candidatus Competibacterales bacterium]